MVVSHARLLAMWRFGSKLSFRFSIKSEISVSSVFALSSFSISPSFIPPGLLGMLLGVEVKANEEKISLVDLFDPQMLHFDRL